MPPDRFRAVERRGIGTALPDTDGRHRYRVLRRPVPESAAGGRNFQSTVVGAETQVSIRARSLDDDETGIRMEKPARVDDLDRVLAAVLGIGGARDDLPVLVDQEQVVVVRRSAQRVSPLQNELVVAVAGDPVFLHTTAEVVADADLGAVDSQRSSRGEVTLPHRGGAVGEVPEVSGRRNVDATIRHGCIDRLGHHVVLKGGFPQVDCPADDHVRSRVAQRLDVGRKLRFPAFPRREVELGLRRQIVGDLQQGDAGGALSCLSRQYRHSVRQFTRRLSPGKGVDTGCDHSDPYTGAVDPMRLPGQIHLVGQDALGPDYPVGRRGRRRSTRNFGRDLDPLAGGYCLIGRSDRQDTLE